MGTRPTSYKSGTGGYRAAQAADGTWTVFSVPIFAEHVDTRSSEPLVFDREWIERALKKAQVRESEGYLPPLHVAHHGDPNGVEAAGKFRITRLSPIKYGGGKVLALFADLVGVRGDIYDRIRRGELSYRSVEILDVDTPEIDSLALLDHEVPYFRFPLLKIGEEATQKKAGAPVLAFSASGGARRILCRFKESEMPEEKKPDEFSDMPEEEKQADPEEEKQEADPILHLLKAIARKLGVVEMEDEGDEEYEADEPEDKVEDPPKQDSASPVEVGKPLANSASFAQAGAQAAMLQRIQQLEARLEDSQRASRVEKQSARLKSRGFSDDAVKEFRSIAKKHGERAAASYAAGLEHMGPIDPPQTWAGELRVEDPEPSEVSKFAQRGPDELEKARGLWRSWQRTQPEVSLEEYLEINMDAAAFMTAARTRGGK